MRQNLKKLGQAVSKHQDIYRRYPLLTNFGPAGSANVYATRPGATFKPGSDGGYLQNPSQAAGYSWIVRLLPFADEITFHYFISAASNKFQLEAFTPREQKFSVTLGGVQQHFACVDLDWLRCPSFGGASISTASSGTATPAVEIKPYAELYAADKQSPSGVRITNYFALAATHLLCMSDPDSIAAAGDTRAEPPNGVIGPQEFIRAKMVTDGTSKTLMICETKEPAVNSWYDGTVAWTVGASPQGKQPLRGDKDAAAAERRWSADGGATGLNVGPAEGAGRLFAPQGTTPSIAGPVSWGPSSDHQGVVFHLMADASMWILADSIDPTLYLQLITRAGNESLEDVELAPLSAEEEKP